jgi:DNA-binding CsgD family transcriptional regulator
VWESRSEVSDAALIGREDELAAINAWLGTVAEGPAAFVLAGEPGIGKTLLWQAGIRDAADAGMSVLAHRSAEAEAGLAFTGLSDLIEPVIDELAGGLASPRRAALEIALLRADAGDVPPDSRAIGLAVRDALVLLARSRPVVLALDDIQWLDRSSADVLATALRRLLREPVRLLATLRSAPDLSPTLDLRQTFDDGRLRLATLEPLELGQLHRLLSARLGLELARPELQELRRISGGNPYFALELARERRRIGVPHAADKPMRIPSDLQELLGDRLARLPEEVLQVLLAAAALPQPTVAMTCAGCADRQRGFDGLQAAASAGIIEIDGSDVRFAHPLLASLCYERALPWERREVHMRLAAASSDIELRARHLALGTEGPDQRVARELDEAAQHAAQRGATAAAAELADLAVLRTPDDPSSLRRRRVAAAALHHLAGDFERATAIYESVLVDTPDGLDRADVLYALAELGTRPLPARAALLEEAIEYARSDDERATRLLGLLAIVRWLLGDADSALEHAREGLACAESVGDPELLAVAIARVGHIEGWVLDVTPGLLERGVAIERTLRRPLMFHTSPAFMQACLLYDQDELARSHEMLLEIEAAAIARGDEHTRLWVVLQWPCIEWYTGQWELGLRHTEEALELAEQTQEPISRGLALNAKARMQAELGRTEEARSSAEAALRGTDGTHDELTEIHIHAILGRLELSRGDLKAASAHLAGLPDRLDATGLRNPAFSPWADAIEVLIGIGDLEQAGAYLARYEGIAADANRWARIGAARCRGMLATARGDHAPAIIAFDESLAHDEPATYPFERARTLLALGIAQRLAQRRRAARETLEEAVSRFEALGARLWAEKARDELSRISGRRAASDELTEAERRVAALAAEGLSNKEIAATQFLSVSTVEAHLHRAFLKLGVRSRTQLARRLLTPDHAARDGSPKV